MSIRLNPYFTFTGQAREALEFYESVFGGELKVASFKDFQAPVDPEFSEMVMHGELHTSHFIIQASDGAAISRPENNATTNMECAVIGAADEVELAREWFDKLQDGATQVMPLNQAPWGAHFGSLTDKFGIAWMFNFGG